MFKLKNERLNNPKNAHYFEDVSVHFRKEKPCDCEHQQDSEPANQQDGNDYSEYAWAINVKRENPLNQQHRLSESVSDITFEWEGKIKPNPSIPWNSWGDYFPDEGKFYFTTRKAGGPFCGQRHTNHLNVMEIKLDARYRMEDHGMIVGWKPYE